MLTNHRQQLKSSTYSDIEDMCMMKILQCTITKVDTMTQLQVDLLMLMILRILVLPIQF